MVQFFIFLLGFGLAVTGGISIIIYLNFLPAGIGWTGYFLFIITRIECYFFPLGILMMLLTLRFFPNYS